MLALLDPATRQPVIASTKQESKSKASTEKRSPLALGFAQSLKLSQEITPLKTAVQKITATYPQLQPGIFLLDLETGNYLNLGGSDTLAAASTIKLPVAVAFFQDFDAGKIRLDEQLTLTTKDIATGSGEMQYKPPGTKFTVLETITKMMTISDNTATNMIINRLGGAEVLNQRFRAWGLTATAIQNRLPDIEGTNTSSARDMANLLAMVAQGDLISMGGRDRLLQIMQRTAINSLLPKGLGEGATIAHKTGSIGSLLADVGLIDLPTGKRYIAAVIVKRPREDKQAQELIRQVSRAAYQYFNQQVPTPNSSPAQTSSVTPFTRPNHN
jgi:beta-lactamase class A